MYPYGRRTQHLRNLLSGTSILHWGNPDDPSLLGTPIRVIPIIRPTSAGGYIHHSIHLHPRDAGRNTLSGVAPQKNRGYGKHQPNPLCINSTRISPVSHQTPPHPTHDFYGRGKTSHPHGMNMALSLSQVTFERRGATTQCQLKKTKPSSTYWGHTIPNTPDTTLPPPPPEIPHYNPQSQCPAPAPTLTPKPDPVARMLLCKIQYQQQLMQLMMSSRFRPTTAPPNETPQVELDLPKWEIKVVSKIYWSQVDVIIANVLPSLSEKIETEPICETASRSPFLFLMVHLPSNITEIFLDNPFYTQKGIEM